MLVFPQKLLPVFFFLGKTREKTLPHILFGGAAKLNPKVITNSPEKQKMSIIQTHYILTKSASEKPIIWQFSMTVVSNKTFMIMQRMT